MTRPGVGIVGAGGWGTALAVLLGANGTPVTLWSRRREHADVLGETRRNDAYLPGVGLPAAVRVTADLRAAAEHDKLIIAVPSQAVRKVWRRLLPHLEPKHRVANASKGIEVDTGLRLSQVLKSEGGPLSPERIAVLSGPNHAEEVGRGLPTTSVVASTCPETAEAWQETLMTRAFRVYTNEDVIGVELGGALKNIIALAAGISDGLGFGDNTKAAIVTRGLAEMSRLGKAMGARVLTFSGLSGMGDLIATCTSRHSRNTRAGKKIGEGASPEAVAGETGQVIEGIPTCRAAVALARKWNVEMPITQAVSDVLFHGKDPYQAVGDLMGRGPKDEVAAILE